MESNEFRNARFVESCEKFDRAWFDNGKAVDVVYHFNPEARTLAVHFANFVSKGVLSPGDLGSLSKGLGGVQTGAISFRLKEIETRECAETFTEFLHDLFEENRRAWLGELTAR